MNGIIHLLPDSVANQIAAGEVIQRPSSVIKELLENAIDAGATLIQVVVNEAGKSSILVVDNGCGMSVTDARLAFERHATSKISKAADLFSLHTMGFRGEALPSIAAVAQVTLRTRRPEDELGTQLVIEGSRIIEQEEACCPVGTSFLVSNLFFNIPARRKFLKSNATELNAVITEFERVALAHPEVAFKLSSGDAIIYDLTIGNERQRIAGLYGKRLDAQLLPVNVSTSIVNLNGFVGSPESAKKRGAHQFFFVNGRYMRHPFFTKAVLTAFERILPEGLQVPFFLKMEVDPSRIDVNIHPAKTEIKFQDESAIWQIVLAAVRETLGKHSAVPTIDFDTENRPDIPCFNPTGNYEVPTVKRDLSYNPFTSSSHASGGGMRNYGQSDFSALLSGLKETRETEETTDIEKRDADAMLCADAPDEEQRLWTQEDVQLFQYQESFIVLPVKSGLMFVHQHRAHVRVLYNRYHAQLLSSGVPSQGMLFPEIVELTPRQSAVIEERMEDLERAGFVISSLGGSTHSINAVPAGVDSGQAGKLLYEIIDSLAAIPSEARETNASEAARHRLALALARQSAVNVRVHLSHEQMSELIEQLFIGESPNCTPDGKLIAATINESQIMRLFD